MEIFEYIAVLTSIIIGLGITQLLRGVARVIQHPGVVQAARTDLGDQFTC